MIYLEMGGERLWCLLRKELLAERILLLSLGHDMII